MSNTGKDPTPSPNGLPTTANENAAQIYELTEKVTELQKVSEDANASRRTALNLMEDAIAAKEALRASEEKYRTLFETMDEGFAIIELEHDEQGNLLDMLYVQANPAFQKHTGLNDPVGKRISDLMPNLGQPIIDMIQRAADTGKPERAETYKIDLQRWFDVVYTRIGGPGSSQVAALFKDITDRKRQEERVKKELQDTQLLQQISNHIIDEADPEVFYDVLLDSAMKLMSADFASIQLFHPQDQELLLLAYKNFHPDSVKHWRVVRAGPASTCGQALATGERVIVTNLDDPSLDMDKADWDAYKLSEINAVQSTPLVSRLGSLVGMISTHWRKPHTPSERELGLFDIVARQVADLFERDKAAVERAKADQALRESESRLYSIANLVPDLLWDSELDGATNWYNQRWLEYTGQSLEEAIGWGWVDSIHPDDREGSARRYAEAVKAGKKLQQERRIRRKDGEYRWFVINASPLKDKSGKVVRMYASATDIHDRKQAEETLRERELQYRARLENEVRDRTVELHQNRALLQATLDSNMEMIQVFKAVRDEKGKIVDFIWVLNNVTSEQIYGDVIGKSLLENNPGVLAAGIFDHFVIAVETGVPQQYEKHYVDEQFNGWFYQSVVKLDDGVATNTVNITERKKAELQVKESRDRLQSILDTTLVQMSILEAVRDEQGIIADLEIKAVNHELEKETGRKDLVGKLYAREYPGIKTAGLFDLIVKAIETGEPQSTEYFYPYEGFNKWFSCMFVKLDDGVVATNMDITDSKQADEERFKNYVLLQQSEDLAALGSWDYDLATKSFAWSDGMYRLFNLEYGSDIQPEIYLEYATAAGRLAAERVVQHIRQGDADFEETLEIDVSGGIKILHLKAAVVRNDQGHAERVLGVDMDISAMRAAEATIRKLEADQQLEIFRVTLRTQEEERRRISESLHNGLGQLLYGIKMSLAQLSAQRAAEDPQKYELSRRYTSDLLSDAIRDSRRISHELMPAVLEEFGLSAAVNDICQQMQDGLKFDCSIEVNDGEIDKYMQLAVFRTLQELMVNVVKHANATQAEARIRLESGYIELTVKDNGCGIDPEKQGKDGIGLASIRSKVDLLNGTIAIASRIGEGTSVTIRLPYVPLRTNLN